MFDYKSLSALGRIGIAPEAEKEQQPEGANCELKLKPTRYPKNPDKSKKCYRGFFIRTVGYFHHIYSIEDNLYIVSLVKQKDPREWIDNNYDEIKRRINDRRNTVSD